MLDVLIVSVNICLPNKNKHYLLLIFTDMTCEVRNGGCDQICTNTNISSECSCFTGYILAADNISCDGKMLMFYAMHLAISAIL